MLICCTDGHTHDTRISLITKYLKKNMRILYSYFMSICSCLFVFIPITIIVTVIVFQHFLILFSLYDDE